MSSAASIVPVITRSVAVLGGLIGACVVLGEGDTSNVLLVIVGMMFAGWAMAPFALAWVAAAKVKTILAAQLIVLAAAVAAVGLSVAVYWPTFVDNAKPDAQDGLVLLFVPIYQLAGIALAVVAANFVARRFAKT
ncbi:MAG: hypothetical protein ACK4TP_14010 [Hyphomicrobium sp.]